MIAIVTANSTNYAELAALTLPNKREYAQRHGYELLEFPDPFHDANPGNIACYEHVELVRQQLPKYDWILWVGCDTIFTDMRRTIESVIDHATGYALGASRPEPGFICAGDDYGLNADVYLVRNTPRMQRLLWAVVHKRPGPTEQDALEYFFMREPYRPLIAWLPQELINAYAIGWYSARDGRPYGENLGGWSRMSWILHLPGMPNAERFPLLHAHLAQVTR